MPPNSRFNRRSTDREEGTPETTKAWHQDRKIQLGHIISTLGLTVTLVVTIVQVTTYIGRVDARVQVLESSMVQQHDRDERQDKATAEALAALRQQLERIDAKLDRLIEGKR